MFRVNQDEDRPRSMEDILAGDDPQGLLEGIEVDSDRGESRADPLVSHFEEINAFLDAQGREPSKEAPDERRLALHLQGIRSRPEAQERLADLDRHGLLQEEDEENQVGKEPETAAQPQHHPVAAEDVTSIDDILASDADGLLDIEDDELDLYEIRHVPAGEQATPDEIAERKPCDEFERYEPLFETIRQRLAEGKAESLRFTNETQIEEGDFFILQGVMCLVDRIGERGRDANDRNDARLRVIYDNGTESNLLLRSLARALYKDPAGKRVVDPDQVLQRMQGITHRDHPTGTIYVLRSLRDHPTIRQQTDLHKIGLTTRSVKDRIRGAERDKTYLEGPVEVVKTIKTYNLRIKRFEGLIHDFFAPRRANFKLTDHSGRAYWPEEWFNVPVEAIERAAELIASGEINRYRLDSTSGEIVEKARGRSRGDREI